MSSPAGREAGRVGVRVVPLTTGFSADLKKYLDAAERELKVSIPATLDTSGAQEDMARLQEELNNSAVLVKVGASTADARAAVDELQRSISGSQADIAVGVDQSKASSDFASIRSNLLTLAGIAKNIVIGGATVAAGAGIAVAVVQAIALVSALAQAAGAAALIPAALAGLGAIVATAVIGLGGIGDALKAAGKASSASSSGGGGNPNAAADQARQIAAAQRGLQQAYTQTADIRVADAKRIVDAEQSIKDAQQSAKDTSASDIQNITNAEQAYTKAQRDELRAQQDLNAAREAAARNIADLKAQLVGASADQESAAQGLAEAQANLAAVQSNDFSTDLERNAAKVAVDQAAAKVKETGQNYKDLQQQSAEANRAGVDGASNVLAAQDRLTDSVQSTARAQQDVVAAKRQEAADQVTSTRAILKAQQDLADAQHQQAEDQVSATNTILDAQDRLAQAQEAAASSAGGASAATNAEAAAMAKLSPNARSLVSALLALGPAWAGVQLAVQDRLLSGVSGRITNLAGRALPILKTGLTGIAGSLNQATTSVLDFATKSSTLSVLSTVLDTAKRGLDNILPAIAPVGTALLALIRVGSGFGPGLAAGFASFASGVATSITKFANDGGLAKFIAGAILSIHQLGQILINVGSIFVSVFEGGASSGHHLLAVIVAATGAVAGFLRSAQGKSDIAAVFAAANAAVRGVVAVLRGAGGVVSGFFASFQSGSGSGAASNIQSIGESLKRIGPAIASAFKHDTIKSFNDATTVTSALLKFAADHVGLLTKALPFLAAGFLAVKAGQAASVFYEILDLPLKASGIVATFLSASANRALAFQLAILTGQQRQGILASVASRIATLAQAAASGIATAATTAWNVATRLLGLAMDALPIVAVVAGVLLLIAGIVEAYKHSETFRKIVQAAFAAVKAAAEAVARFFTQDVPAAFSRVVAVARAALDWVKAHWPVILEILTGPFGLAYAAIKGHFQDIRDAVTGLVGDLRNAGKRIWSWITEFLGVEERGLKNIWSTIVGFVQGLGGRIRSAASGIWDGITDAFRSAINKVIDIWDSLHFSVPGVKAFGHEVGGFSIGVPHIPHLSQGGDILPQNGGTLALLAETGRGERVTDIGKGNRNLDLQNQLMEKVLSLTNGTQQKAGPTTFNVTSTEADPTLVAAQVAQRWARNRV